MEKSKKKGFDPPNKQQRNSALGNLNDLKDP